MTPLAALALAAAYLAVSFAAATALGRFLHACSEAFDDARGDGGEGFKSDHDGGVNL